jgi:OOP family OmpA-OmpF porin
MRNPARLAAILALLAQAASAWAAQPEWYVSGGAVWTDDDGSRKIDDAVSGGQVNAGGQLSERIGLEGMLGYHDIAGFPGQEHLELGVNVLARLAPDFWISPYALAGVGYLDTETTTSVTDNRGTLSFGLGFRLRLGETRVALRGEYRARLAYRGSEHLTDRLGLLGIEIRFGGGPDPIVDVDADGVDDYLDRCRHSPPGAVVGADGCEPDGDGDGVRNTLDACPDTPPGAWVDASGCTPDEDSDGIGDSVDQCPGTIGGVPVDATGCEPDDDGDFLVNRLDDCPNTPAGARVDIHGCEIRAIIELPGLNFENNSDRLMPGSDDVLADVAATLTSNPDLQVVVAGHTDSDGSAEFNLGLSSRRAQTVRDHLIKAGVDPVQLTAVGFGESEPLASNDTPAGKAKNRRVELRVIQGNP